ncbi:LYR motif-containing protein 4-like [Ptychodera flava]|uniref:LYR motif-containing protein 4-like n=1 Tax=Ptychodera flava TaxID=63121 RepID=UPI00396A337A
MATSRMKVLSLYKQLLRESKKFTGYNFRTYAYRRIQDAFQENKSVTESVKINELVTKAEKNLELLKRQVTISQIYSEPKLVIEVKQGETVEPKQ